MTTRLYYGDSYLREFRASLEPQPGEAARVYLDQSAFYPESGGQPYDKGRIGDASVIEVVDEADRIVHVLDRPLAAGQYECLIDWQRRFDHMQQHSGQHLLSATLIEVLGTPTVSFHLGSESSTIDVEAATIDPAQLATAELHANEFVFENRPITVTYHDAGDDIGLRKASEREGVLRVVTIEDLDRSACGGTHVRSTAEIGPIQIRKLDKIRGNVRIEFVCGLRTVTRTRADYDALLQVARTFSSSLEETPALAAAYVARVADAEKMARKLSGELAAARGRELQAVTSPNAKGLRLKVQSVQNGPIPEELRAEAQAFAACGGSAYLVLCRNPASLLLAASDGLPFQAGAVLKPLLERHGGRGGGNPRMAQGSVPTAEALAAIEAELLALLA